MKICMLVYAFYENDTRVQQYARALTTRGDSVDVIAVGREGALSFEVIEGVNVYRIQTRRVNEAGRFSYLIRLLRFLSVSAFVLTQKYLAAPYDVVHVHSVPDFLVFAAIVPKVLGARIILDIHDILPEFYVSKFGKDAASVMFRVMIAIERLSIAFAHHVIVANHVWQDRLTARSVAKDKCTTILNYPDPDIFYVRQRSRQDGRFVILYPGTLNPHQGVDIAILAFSVVAEEMPNAELHIYGEGPARTSLVQLATKLGLIQRICFHDFVPTEQIAHIMAEADLAVVPKRASSLFGNEAASTKIMEFMSLGVPVIVSRTTIDTFYHNDSRVAFFRSEEPTDLATCMLHMYRHPEYRRELVASALVYVQHNRWPERQHDYLDLIDRLAASPMTAARMELRH